MPSPKTQPTAASVRDFLASIGDEGQRSDATELDARMRRLSGTPGTMWGAGIVGYGRKAVMQPDGRAAEWMRVGFAPRSGKLAIYGVGAVEGAEEVRTRLGRHSAGKGCLYVRRLADVDLDVLDELLRLAL